MLKYFFDVISNPDVMVYLRFKIIYDVFPALLYAVVTRIAFVKFF